MPGDGPTSLTHSLAGRITVIVWTQMLGSKIQPLHHQQEGAHVERPVEHHETSFTSSWQTLVAPQTGSSACTL